MSNISKRRREGSRAKIKSMGDHKEFLKRITKTLYYGELPRLPCLSLPVTEVSCAAWSAAQQGRSLRRLHADAAARLARGARVSPCALVLALLYLERLRAASPHYLAAAAPAELFLVSLMVGNKFLQDDGEDAEVLGAEWAAAGGLPRAQLNKLEIEFLNAIEWNIYVSDESFESGLARLERAVALRQAAARGFFTYGDLAAAGAGAPGARAAAAAALALALSYVALLASALLVACAAPLLQPRASLDTRTAPVAPRLSNATVRLPAFDVRLPAEPARPRCCTEWLKYQDTTEPEKTWSEAPVDWQWVEKWWRRAAALAGRWRGAADALRRWLKLAEEYTERSAPLLDVRRLAALAAGSNR